MDWYALFVKTGKEEIVQKWLDYHFNKMSLHSLVPKRKLIERKAGKTQSIVRKLFPGYILISTDMSITTYKTIKNIPNLINILGNDTYFSRIPEEEILPILNLIGAGDTIGCSKIFIENSKVVVNSGPLKNMEGIIKRIDKRKKRAKVMLNFMGSQKIIDLSIDVLEN